MSWSDWADEEATRIRAAGQWRSVRDLDGGGPEFTLDGRPVTSFASNDYLGLSQHPAVVAAAHEALDRSGAGSGSARLIVGGRPVHRDLEDELAAWKAQERAVLFATGFAANLGVLSVVGGPGVTVLSDELNHASIIDGCRLSRSAVAIYRHGDLEHLSVLLADVERAVVVTDTVFSMDGDVADLAGLGAVCADHGALLVLDEAHAVLGPDLPDGLGAEVLRVGTLSKTLGSLGGFVAGPGPLVDLLVNRARSFIFTTASSPADTAAALAAVRVLRSAEGQDLVTRLRANVDRVRPGHPSPIVPVVLGDEARAVAASAALLERGLLVPAIRPPTVPPGSSRLRITLSAAHTDEDVSRLLVALDELNAARPDRTVVVVGTGTDVGKTWVTAALARELVAAGVRVAARKPAQSFAPDDPVAGRDAGVLGAATGEDPDAVCPPHRSYEVPLAPPMAAAALGRPPIVLADLLAELTWPTGCEVGFVETVGGVRSPISDDADGVAMIDALAPDLVLLVADAGLGTLNLVRLTVAALGDRPTVTILNRYNGTDALHRDNRAWLAARDGLDVVTSVAALTARLS